jgi:hypothetical protein
MPFILFYLTPKAVALIAFIRNKLIYQLVTSPTVRCSSGSTQLCEPKSTICTIPDSSTAELDQTPAFVYNAP